jgi:hypothetical protein
VPKPPALTIQGKSSTQLDKDTQSDVVHKRLTPEKITKFCPEGETFHWRLAGSGITSLSRPMLLNPLALWAKPAGPKGPISPLYYPFDAINWGNLRAIRPAPGLFCPHKFVLVAKQAA